MANPLIPIGSLLDRAKLLSDRHEFDAASALALAVIDYMPGPDNANILPAIIAWRGTVAALAAASGHLSEDSSTRLWAIESSAWRNVVNTITWAD